jgi:K+-transporting ATPase ATPase A chain
MPTVRTHSRNPPQISNLFQLVCIFAIGGGLHVHLGRMTCAQRHGWAVWAANAILFVAE